MSSLVEASHSVVLPIIGVCIAHRGLLVFLCICGLQPGTACQASRQTSHNGCCSMFHSHYCVYYCCGSQFSASVFSVLNCVVATPETHRVYRNSYPWPLPTTAWHALVLPGSRCRPKYSNCSRPCLVGPAIKIRRHHGAFSICNEAVGKIQFTMYTADCRAGSVANLDCKPPIVKHIPSFKFQIFF